MPSEFHPATDDLVKFLNELLALDARWLTALVKNRPTCNKALADHPTVQVATIGLGEPGHLYACGMLGVLNGFCGAFADGPRKGWGPITAEIDDATHQITSFRRTENTPL